MSEVTSFLRATAVLSAGLEDGDEVALFPFFKVDLHEGLQSRRVFVNYTFGESAGDGSPPKFENDAGEVKLQLFHRLKTKVGAVMVIVIMAKTKDRIKEKILEHLWQAPAEARILFIFPRSVADDTAFYEALDIPVNGQQPQAGATDLQELGLKIDPPFITVTLEELREGIPTKKRKKCKKS